MVAGDGDAEIVDLEGPFPEACPDVSGYPSLGDRGLAAVVLTGGAPAFCGAATYVC